MDEQVENPNKLNMDDESYKFSDPRLDFPAMSPGHGGFSALSCGTASSMFSAFSVVVAVVAVAAAVAAAGIKSYHY